MIDTARQLADANRRVNDLEDLVIALRRQVRDIAEWMAAQGVIGDDLAKRLLEATEAPHGAVHLLHDPDICCRVYAEQQKGEAERREACIAAISAWFEARKHNQEAA